MNRNTCFLIIRNQKLDAKEKKIACLFKLSTTYLESSSNESFPLFSFSPLFAFLRFRERNIGTRVSKLDGFLKREGARCIVFKRGVEDGWKEEFRRIGCSLFSCFRSFPSDRNSSWLIRCLLSVFSRLWRWNEKIEWGIDFPEITDYIALFLRCACGADCRFFENFIQFNFGKL